MKIATTVASRLRSKNRLNGTTGFSAVRSTHANAPNATTPIAAAPRVVTEIQPFSGPIEKANTAAVQASVANTAPAASSFIRSRLVSRSAVRAR
jgi:hypothetical protein